MIDIDDDEVHLLNCTRQSFSVRMELKQSSKIVLSFGVIADIQYADAPDGSNFSGLRRRYYRGSLNQLEVAVSSWKNDAEAKPSFVLQLGDILDGINKRLNISQKSLNTIVGILERLQIPLYHIWGNHEYYNFTREELLKSHIYSGNLDGCVACPGKGYYCVQPHPKFKIIALDSYEVSLLASPEGSDEYHLANEMLTINPNEEKNSALGLHGSDMRFVKFNGAVGENQLKWLRQNLTEATELEQNVIVMGHCSVYEPSTDANCLCWDAPEVLAMLQEYSHCIICYMAGHNHFGGYAVDPTDIHHITFPGVVENNEGSDFGTVYVSKTMFRMKGNGRVKDVQIPLRYKLA